MNCSKTRIIALIAYISSVLSFLGCDKSDVSPAAQPAEGATTQNVSAATSAALPEKESATSAALPKNVAATNAVASVEAKG